jgi:hypothetical protein
MANVNKAIFPPLYGSLYLITIEAGLLKPKVMMDLETQVFAHIASRSPDAPSRAPQIPLGVYSTISRLAVEPFSSCQRHKVANNNKRA